MIKQYQSLRKANPEIDREFSPGKQSRVSASLDSLLGLSFGKFNRRIGLPKKEGKEMPIFDYEWQVLKELQKHRRIYVKKATGLGITELMLRTMAWLCTRDNSMKGSQMCIVTGPNIDLAIGLIKRLKAFFDVAFDTRETVCMLNGCEITAYPSHHLDSMRSLARPSFILLDEADFFPPGQQRDARDVSERYIAKSNPYIALVSTPNLPGGLFDQIEKEPADNCLYSRIFLDYTRGIDRIYSNADLKIARMAPGFEREYNLKFGYGIGNIFPYKLLDRCTEVYDLRPGPGRKVLAIDPAYGSSKFAMVGMEERSDILYVIEARQYERPSPSAMLDVVAEIARDYDITLVDSAHPGLILDLADRGFNSQPVVFAKELSAMTTAAATAVKQEQIRIHEGFSDLAFQLRAVEFDAKGHPDKRKLSFDLGDAFLMAVNHFKSAPFLSGDI